MIYKINYYEGRLNYWWKSLDFSTLYRPIINKYITSTFYIQVMEQRVNKLLKSLYLTLRNRIPFLPAILQPKGSSFTDLQSYVWRYRKVLPIKSKCIYSYWKVSPKKSSIYKRDNIAMHKDYNIHQATFYSTETQ